MDYLMPKTSFQKNSKSTYRKENKGIHCFPKSISTKVNSTVWS